MWITLSLICKSVVSFVCNVFINASILRINFRVAIRASLLISRFSCNIIVFGSKNNQRTTLALILVYICNVARCRCTLPLYNDIGRRCCTLPLHTVVYPNIYLSCFLVRLVTKPCLYRLRCLFILSSKSNNVISLL